MTSPTPLLFDTYYHIYNRGNNRENIFIEERNYEYFLKLYEKHISPVAETFAYCLLKNHFHVCVRTKSEQEVLETRKPLGSKYASDQFSNFFNAYAKSINKAYGRTGSLFQHPFGRVPITSDRQFWNVIAYTCESTTKTHKNINSCRIFVIGNTHHME